MKRSAYIKINVILAGIVLLMLGYSGYYSNKKPHPIKSAYNEQVFSTGMSRAFSEIVRLNFDKANAYNPYAIFLFLFFFIQLIMRTVQTLLLLSNSISYNILLYTDIVLSVLLFLLCYGQFIWHQLQNVKFI